MINQNEMIYVEMILDISVDNECILKKLSKKVSKEADGSVLDDYLNG